MKPKPETLDTAVLRAIDAAANRAREGLRVVEDYVRFVLDDRHLTGLCKAMRHELVAALDGVSLSDRLVSRETRRDVGTTITTASEQSRATALDVLMANFTRLEESLRSLEEFGKMLDPVMATRIEAVRYQTYTLQKATCATATATEQLADARLYVLLDGCDIDDELRTLAGALIEAGADILQLRDKRLDDPALLDRARVLREATRGTATRLIINDRPDIAVLCDADGVHLGQEDLSVKDARAIVGPKRLIGVSTHAIEQARAAVLDGADYLGAGPTFPSGTKDFETFPGLGYLGEIASEIRLPIFAIGGICEANLDQVLATGIGRIATAGAITEAEAPGEVTRRLKERLLACQAE